MQVNRLICILKDDFERDFCVRLHKSFVFKANKTCIIQKITNEQFECYYRKNGIDYDYDGSWQNQFYHHFEVLQRYIKFYKVFLIYVPKMCGNLQSSSQKCV